MYLNMGVSCLGNLQHLTKKQGSPLRYAQGFSSSPITLIIKELRLIAVTLEYYWFIETNWRRQWHPTPVLLPGKSHGQSPHWWAAVHGVARSRTRLRTSLSLFPFMHWRRKWQPTSVFLPGESQGRGSLVGRHLWGRTESDTTETT